MSERKVLNKYYPPDFDQSKLPKLKQGRNRQFVIRIMAPFSMRCKTCGEYIYKGRKFNSRMETVENENYLGLRIYRFYIRCTKCISEITFKTDPENTDYTMEDGATRNFEAFKAMTKQIEQENKAKEDEEANNPMKALENRTRDSKREMESLEKLEELRDLNQRISTVDHDKLIAEHLKKNWLSKQEEEDEKLVQKMFSTPSGPDGYVKRIFDQSSSSEDEESPSSEASKDHNLTIKNKAGNSSGSKTSCSDILLPIPSDIGPSVPMPKQKMKLKSPNDISAMVTLKKPKKDRSETKSEKPSEAPTTDCSVSTETKCELPSLPPVKINLKKSNDYSNVKIKGGSLSLLGDYSDSDPDSSDS